VLDTQVYKQVNERTSWRRARARDGIEHALPHCFRAWSGMSRWRRLLLAFALTARREDPVRSARREPRSARPRDVPRAGLRAEGVPGGARAAAYPSRCPRSAGRGAAGAVRARVAWSALRGERGPLSTADAGDVRDQSEDELEVCAASSVCPLGRLASGRRLPMGDAPACQRLALDLRRAATRRGHGAGGPAADQARREGRTRAIPALILVADDVLTGRHRVDP